MGMGIVVVSHLGHTRALKDPPEDFPMVTITLSGVCQRFVLSFLEIEGGRLGSLFALLSLNFFEEHLLEDVRSPVVIIAVVLHEAPPVDVDDKTGSICAEQVETTDSLTEAFCNSSCDSCFLLVERGDISDFLATGIALDETVHDWRLPRLGMAEVGSNRVCLDVLGVLSL